MLMQIKLFIRFHFHSFIYLLSLKVFTNIEAGEIKKGKENKQTNNKQLERLFLSLKFTQMRNTNYQYEFCCRCKITFDVLLFRFAR